MAGIVGMVGRVGPNSSGVGISNHHKMGTFFYLSSHGGNSNTLVHLCLTRDCSQRHGVNLLPVRGQGKSLFFSFFKLVFVSHRRKSKGAVVMATPHRYCHPPGVLSTLSILSSTFSPFLLSPSLSLLQPLHLSLPPSSSLLPLK